MVKLLVTCAECGLQGTLAPNDQEFKDPYGKCKHLVNPTKCRSLRVSLIGARRMLEYLEWDALVDTQDAIPSPIVAPTGSDEDAPETFPALPLVAQDSEAIRLAPSEQADVVEGDVPPVDRSTMVTDREA